MITYHDGDLLKSGCDVIAHQVNEYGVMGAGIAKQIRDKFPEVYESYKGMVEACREKGLNLYGTVHSIVTNQKHKYIANCFTQRNGVTDYNLLKTAVTQLRGAALMSKAKTIGIPYKYGCGIARGDWKEVEKIWTDAFKDSDIELQIWRL